MALSRQHVGQLYKPIDKGQQELPIEKTTLSKTAVIEKRLYDHKPFKK